MPDYATIQVHQGTKERLAGLRRVGETYDAALQRIIAAALRAEEDDFLQELDDMYADDDAFAPLP